MTEKEFVEEEVVEEYPEEEVEEQTTEEKVPKKRRVFSWEITQFISSSSLLALKPFYNPNERKLSKRFGVIFLFKNKRRDGNWSDVNVLFRINEIAKIYEFLNTPTSELKRSTYYFDLRDKSDLRTISFLTKNSKLVDSVVKDVNNEPIVLILQHRYTDKDGNQKGKVIMFVKGTDEREDKYRGKLYSDYLKIIVAGDDGVFLKKLSDVELENFKLQLYNITQMTSTIPVIWKLDYIINLLRSDEKD